MLTTVEVTSANGVVLRLPLQDVTDGYLVEEVEGLEPVNATLVSSTFSQIDGSRFHSAHTSRDAHWHTWMYRRGAWRPALGAAFASWRRYPKKREACRA